MNKEKIIAVVIVGLVAGAVIFAAFAGLDVLLGNAETFVDGMKSIRNIAMGVIGAVGVTCTGVAKVRKK